MNSRRKFILDCSIFDGCTTAAPVSSFSLPSVSSGELGSVENIGRQEFFRKIGTVFRVRLSCGAAVDLKLLKAPLASPKRVTQGRPLAGDAGYEKFSLIFSGPKNALLPSVIHYFEHEELGRFEMYLGQIGTINNEDVRYEAGFNRPAPAVRDLLKT